jgi:hypothetical protein
MKFFSGGKRRRLSGTAWEYHSEFAIWRIYPTGSIWIAFEERDTEKKKATFSCLNRLTGEVAWSGQFLSDWWVGVEAVTGEALILHGFATPDMPMHKGITVIDLPSGTLLWEHPDFSFEACGEDAVIGSLGPHGRKHYTAMEVKSGQVLRQWSEGDTPTALDEIEGFSPPSVMFPVTAMDAGVVIPPVVQNVLGERREWVSWIQAGSAVVLSVQQMRPGDRITQVLSIINDHGKEVFHDTISAGVFVPDAFLVQAGMLYYVRAGKDLVAVNLETVAQGGKHDAR